MRVAIHYVIHFQDAVPVSQTPRRCSPKVSVREYYVPNQARYFHIWTSSSQILKSIINKGLHTLLYIMLTSRMVTLSDGNVASSFLTSILGQFPRDIYTIIIYFHNPRLYCQVLELTATNPHWDLAKYDDEDVKYKMTQQICNYHLPRISIPSI